VVVVGVDGAVCQNCALTIKTNDAVLMIHLKTNDP